MPVSTQKPAELNAHVLKRADQIRKLLCASFALGCALAGGCNQNNQKLLAPPLIWWTRKAPPGPETRCFLPPLYRQTQKDEGRETHLDILWPLYSYSRESEPSGTGGEYYDVRLSVLGILFSMRSDNYGAGRTKIQFLWPLGSYFSGETSERGEMRRVLSFNLLPFVHYERSWRRESQLRSASVRSNQIPAASPRPDERVYLRVLHITFGTDMEAHTGKQRCFILGAAPTGDDGSKTTFGAIAFERGPGMDFEYQLFWRAILFKSYGSSTPTSLKVSDLWRSLQKLWKGPPHKLIRLGPVASWESDWESDRSMLSILAGLFSMERKGLSREGRVLWFFPWRTGPR